MSEAASLPEQPLKHVVSVSLGSASRDVDQVVEILGQPVRIERRGTQGDFAAARRLIADLDGHVDAIGLGGIDLYIVVGRRRYVIRDAARLAAAARRTPVVCGAGLKDSLERRAVQQLAKVIDWPSQKVLMVSAVDRFGMAEELAAQGARVLFGDALFTLGIPLPLYRLWALRAIAHLLVPVVTKLPFSWLYPTGDAQESQGIRRLDRYYHWADVIAGDWHFIRRFAPERLDGKTILTNTTTAADIEFLRRRGAQRLITTTPRFQGRSVGTNLLEAAFVAIEGPDLQRADYDRLIAEAGLEPTVLELGEPQIDVNERAAGGMPVPPADERR